MSLFDRIEPVSAPPSAPGISLRNGVSYFAIYSSHAESVILGLFESHKKEPTRTIPLHRTGDIWHIALKNLPSNVLYAYQCHGKWDEKTGSLFNPEQWLLDPYAKLIDSSPVWNQAPLPRALAFAQKPEPFDWEAISPPSIPRDRLIIYEMHVRGFTAHPSAKAQNPATYDAMIEKIPYLKSLGINAVELLPVFEFDECHCKNIDPNTHKRLPNYWGYNPLSFFALKQSYGSLFAFKSFVKECHRSGIEVILDVVYNHSGEGKEKDYAISFRGIDNSVYYLVGPQGAYRDYTGCGNTINANHPIVEQLILDSLRYWALEMHIDGFRFDLCSTFTRGLDGNVISHPPILQAIANDPILSKVKLIAEPWDATGLYQAGLFPTFGPWMEWNGTYRDTARRFLKGSSGQAGLFANALSGSDRVYSQTPLSSINFITSHDGFSLRDLMTYQAKHNWANGESNRDGSDHNDNWNCGAEAETSDAHILQLRERQMRNHLLALLLSQGIPMLTMGDEYGHTKRGNNNPYVQDNELNWFLWDELALHQDIFHFTKDLIAFRKRHPQLQKNRFLTSEDVSWHGHQPHAPDWSSASRFVAFSTNASPRLYVAFNADYRAATVQLPSGTSWQLIVNTSDGWDRQFFSKQGAILASTVQLEPYSALVAKEASKRSKSI